jgi:hypothetical protein
MHNITTIFDSNCFIYNKIIHPQNAKKSLGKHKQITNIQLNFRKQTLRSISIQTNLSYVHSNSNKLIMSNLTPMNSSGSLHKKKIMPKHTMPFT